MTMYFGKMADCIQMPFFIKGWVAQGTRLQSPLPLTERGKFLEEMVQRYVKYRENAASAMQK